MFDWILLQEGTANDIKVAIREYATLYEPVVPRNVEVWIRQLSTKEWAVVFPESIPPYTFTNLVGWLNEPPDMPAVSGAVGWYTAAGRNQRYLLVPDISNEAGDTLIGRTKDGECIDVYLPETLITMRPNTMRPNTMRPNTMRPNVDSWIDEDSRSLESSRGVDEFEITIDADVNFGNPGFEITQSQ